MKQGQAQIEGYLSLHPSRYSVLSRMELIQEFGECCGQHLTIELQPPDSDNHEVLVLRFTRVRELRFVPGTWSVVPICLEITSMTEQQWEGVHYRVTDCEDLDFSFNCDEFTATVTALEGSNVAD